jgi:hypothetical protein
MELKINNIVQLKFHHEDDDDDSTFHAAFMVIVSPEYIRFPSKSHEFFDGIVTCLELASIKNLFYAWVFFFLTGLLSLIITMHCDMSSFDTRMWKSHKFL